MYEKELFYGKRAFTLRRTKMHILSSVENDFNIVLSPDKVYYVNRMTGKMHKEVKNHVNVVEQEGNQIDIYINDKSISRRHCSLQVLETGLVLADQSSNGTQLSLNGNFQKLASGPFSVGLQSCSITVAHTKLEIQYIHINLAISGLSNSLETELTQLASSLGMVVSNTVNENTTYLVMTKLSATAKLLQALALCIPIVTLEFIETIGSSGAVPDFKLFLPQATLSIDAIPNDARKVLMKDMAVVYLSETDISDPSNLIPLIGGFIMKAPESYQEYRLFLENLVEKGIHVVVANGGMVKNEFKSIAEDLKIPIISTIDIYKSLFMLDKSFLGYPTVSVSSSSKRKAFSELNTESISNGVEGLGLEIEENQEIHETPVSKRVCIEPPIPASQPVRDISISTKSIYQHSYSLSRPAEENFVVTNEVISSPIRPPQATFIDPSRTTNNTLQTQESSQSFLDSFMDDILGLKDDPPALNPPPCGEISSVTRDNNRMVVPPSHELPKANLTAKVTPRRSWKLTDGHLASRRGYENGLPSLKEVSYVADKVADAPHNSDVHEVVDAPHNDDVHEVADAPQSAGPAGFAYRKINDSLTSITDPITVNVEFVPLLQKPMEVEVVNFKRFKSKKELQKILIPVAPS